jgi:hypothetical protein
MNNAIRPQLLHRLDKVRHGDRCRQAVNQDRVTQVYAAADAAEMKHRARCKGIKKGIVKRPPAKHQK